jgi:hypothetical protein
MTRNRFFAGLLFFSIVRAQDVPPPPKPKDNGPSLEVTMKYIQDKLNGQGVVSYTYIEPYSKILQPTNPSRDQESYRVFGAIADASKCTLSWQIAHHFHSDYSHQNEDSEYKGVLSFRDTAKLVVEPYTGWLLPLDDIQPPVLQLRVVMNAPKLKELFLFREEETAGRMAKAMVHAVELCGGGDKDPFQ